MRIVFQLVVQFYSSHDLADNVNPVQCPVQCQLHQVVIHSIDDELFNDWLGSDIIYTFSSLFYKS